MMMVMVMMADRCYQVYLEAGSFINAFDAYRRSRSLKCAVCKLPGRSSPTIACCCLLPPSQFCTGANVGCCIKSCPRSFHIGCVIKVPLNVESVYVYCKCDAKSCAQAGLQRDDNAWSVHCRVHTGFS